MNTIFSHDEFTFCFINMLCIFYKLLFILYKMVLFSFIYY